MSAEKNELLDYIDDKLSADFTEKAVLKQTEFGKVALYRHKKSGENLIKIISANRNDDVFRRLRGKKSPHLPCIYDVCSTDE